MFTRSLRTGAFASATRTLLRQPTAVASRPIVLSLRFNSSTSNKLNPEAQPFTYSSSPLLKYTEEHEYVAYHGDDSTAFIGITKYAADALGDCTYIELPEVGTEVAQGDVLGSVESVKSASEIYSPVNGTISEVNSNLESDPSLINSDPMGNGWIVVVKAAPDFTGEELLDEEAYQKLLEEHDE